MRNNSNCINKIFVTYPAKIPHLYFCTRIHKIGIPIRLIVKSLLSPFHNSSKFLKNIINDYTYTSQKYEIIPEFYISKEVLILWWVSTLLVYLPLYRWTNFYSLSSKIHNRIIDYKQINTIYKHHHWDVEFYLTPIIMNLEINFFKHDLGMAITYSLLGIIYS